MQRRFARISAVALAAALAFGSALAADPIKIGVAEALSGGAAQYGIPIRNAFQMAVEEINAAGGVNGRPLELVVEDEQGKKEEAINAFKKLIFQDKALMLFGPTLSNSAKASDPIAQASKIVVFGTSNTADGITTIGDHVFRNSVTEADVLPVTIRIASKVARIKKVAVLYGNDDVFTKSGYDAFKKALDDQKMPITTTETFAKGDVDFKAQLTKIKATNPDAIVLSALLAEGAPIMVQARQLGLNVPFIGGNGMNSVKVFDLAKGASDGLWVGSPWSIENRTPANNSFIIAYTKEVQLAAGPVRRPGLRRDAHRRRGDEEGQVQRRPGQGPRGPAGLAAGHQVERRDRPVCLPPRQRRLRQAHRLRRQPGRHRQHHARQELRNREVN